MQTELSQSVQKPDAMCGHPYDGRKRVWIGSTVRATSCLLERHMILWIVQIRQCIRRPEPMSLHKLLQGIEQPNIQLGDGVVGTVLASSRSSRSRRSSSMLVAIRSDARRGGTEGVSARRDRWET